MSNFETLVLGGGFMRGVILLGGLESLYELNLMNNIQTYIGTLVGAVISFFLSLGFNPAELQFFSLNLVKKLQSTITQTFIESGHIDHNIILSDISNLLESKQINPKMTLMEHHKLTNKNIIIPVYVVDEKKEQTEYFSWNNYPEIECLTVLRMTISIPILFQPISCNHSFFMDGGIEPKNNLPFHKSCDDSSTVVFYLTDGTNQISKQQFGKRTVIRLRPMIHSLNVMIQPKDLQLIFEISKRRTQIQIQKIKIE